MEGASGKQKLYKIPSARISRQRPTVQRCTQARTKNPPPIHPLSEMHLTEMCFPSSLKAKTQNDAVRHPAILLPQFTVEATVGCQLDDADTIPHQVAGKVLRLGPTASAAEPRVIFFLNDSKIANQLAIATKRHPQRLLIRVIPFSEFRHRDNCPSPHCGRCH